MKVLISTNLIRQPLEARRWMQELGHSVFDDFQTWIRQQEPAWGEAFVFIELSAPQPRVLSSRRNQIDMLLCFSDRIALCEVKSTKVMDDKKLREAVDQINDQVEWLTALLRESHFKIPDRSFRKYLLLPLTNQESISRVKQRLICPLSSQHIWPVGGRHTALYFVDSLARPPWEPLRLPSGIPSVGRFLYRQLSCISSMREFNSFTNAQEFLATLLPTSQMLLDPWHVPDIWHEQLSRTLLLLEQYGLVEILGSPGSGKSTIIKEALNQIEHDVIEISLPSCKTATEVCAAINNLIHIDSPRGLGEEQFVGYLVTNPYAFWISHYEESSAPAVDRFLQLLHRYAGRDSKLPSRWLIESSTPRPILSSKRVDIGRLGQHDICAVLQKIPPSSSGLDVEHVATISHGNPARAIHIWQGGDPSSEPTAANSFRWFTKQLTRIEQHVLPILCLTAAKSPFGITAEALTKCATRILDQAEVVVADSREEVATAVHALLNRLQFCQLAHVRRIERRSFSTLFNDIIPEGCALTIVSSVLPAFIKDQTDHMDGAGRERIENEFRDLLLQLAADSTTNLSLAEVTLGFTVGSLEEFVKSGFRFSCLTMVLDWIQRNEWRPANHEQRCLLRLLHVFLRLSQNPDTDIAEELHGVEARHGFAQYLQQLIEARAFGRALRRGDPLEDLRHAAENMTNVDAMVEALISLANALEQSDEQGHLIAWNIIQDLPGRLQPGSAAQSLALQQLLAFLNRQPSRDNVLSHDQASGLIRSASSQLVGVGFQTQNIQLIADGLFYYVRSCELQLARTPALDVSQFKRELRFIGSIQSRRGRRIQLLLTEGSVHRHFCTNKSIPWEEFRRHMEASVDCYERAFRCAMVMQRADHVARATSYMMDVCLKALPVAQDADAADALIAANQRVIQCADSGREMLTRSLQGDEITGTLYSVRLAYPLVAYLSDLHSTRDWRRLDSLFVAFNSAIRKPRKKSYEWKAVQISLKRLARILEFEARFVQPAFRLSRKIRSQVRQILEFSAGRRLAALAWDTILTHYAACTLAEVAGDIKATQFVLSTCLTLVEDAGASVAEFGSNLLQNVLPNWGLLTPQIAIVAGILDATKSETGPNHPSSNDAVQRTPGLS